MSVDRGDILLDMEYFSPELVDFFRYETKAVVKDTSYVRVDGILFLEYVQDLMFTGREILAEELEHHYRWTRERRGDS